MVRVAPFFLTHGVDVAIFSFSNRAVNEWNILDGEIISECSLAGFKRKLLDRHLRDKRGYTSCLKKTSHHLRIAVICNLDIHDPITTIFGTRVTGKVRNHMMLYFSTSHI